MNNLNVGYKRFKNFKILKYKIRIVKNLENLNLKPQTLSDQKWILLVAESPHPLPPGGLSNNEQQHKSISNRFNTKLRKISK